MTSQWTESVPGLDPNTLEKRQVTDASQVHPSVYGHGYFPPPPPPTASKVEVWNIHRADNGSIENGIASNSGQRHDQQTELTVSRDVQGVPNVVSLASTSSSLGAANGSQEHASYTSYPSSANAYGYGNSGFQAYYYDYQTQSNHSYSQQVGAYQTSGAPYQSHPSFQNTGSYVGSASYSSTHHYAATDYQTAGGYQSNSYGNQSNLWNDGNYGHYHYPSYQTFDSSGSHNSTTMAATSFQYQQHNQPWTDPYGQNASDVSCAPGTENMPVATASAVDCPIPGFSSGYTSNSQPPPPGTAPWKPDSSSTELSSLQVSSAGYDNRDDCWKVGAPGFQNNHMNQVASYYQKPVDSNPLPYGNFEEQKSVHSQVPNPQFAVSHHVPQNFHSPSQTVPTLDTRRVSKLQIPTNPRIASTLALGMPKIDKDSSTTDAASKPAYISVSVSKPINKVASNDTAEVKPPMIPPSFCAYVERALARCKDDSQKAACQNIMREMITKASADGTLFTRDWDTEPLFQIPNASGDSINKANLQSSSIVSSLTKLKRSPSRRTKSRWEPIQEEKLVENPASVNHDPVKDVRWDHTREKEKVVSTGKYESKEGSYSSTKLFSSQLQNLPNNDVPRQAKRQRLDGSCATENGDASSDSDKEKSLTIYYSAAIALENSPEERKRRENRFKRFEKGHEHRPEIKHFRPKGAGAGNLYARRANALLLSRSNEDSCCRAVEDIDWDALTVKGTCQEIEKRYLRLTSAPDPASVRPEEVLEKALLMVQSLEKNYLYKCDQLKSIRQDLTVQRIRNELTVKVYETHARLSLEAGDMPEYNQCQSQLKILYAEGIKGCNLEFAAYHLLCVILHSNNNRDLLSSMARLSAEAKEDEAVKHALAVRAAVTSGNYVLFFRLYKTAPNLNTLLMDLYLEKMRFEAVRCMSRSYRPAVPVAYIAQVLGFTGNGPIDCNDERDIDGVEECEEWLKAHGASLIVDNNGEQQMDSKVSSHSLYMPEPEDAVAHGDASLAVNDFLTRTS